QKPIEVNTAKETQTWRRKDTAAKKKSCRPANVIVSPRATLDNNTNTNSDTVLNGSNTYTPEQNSTETDPSACAPSPNNIMSEQSYIRNHNNKPKKKQRKGNLTRSQPQRKAKTKEGKDEHFRRRFGNT